MQAAVLFCDHEHFLDVKLVWHAQQANLLIVVQICLVAFSDHWELFERIAFFHLHVVLVSRVFDLNEVIRHMARLTERAILQYLVDDLLLILI